MRSIVNGPVVTPDVERAKRVKKLNEELVKVRREIDEAAKAYDRDPRRLPPSLVVPEAYRRRREILEELEALGIHRGSLR